jgi:O-antigen ligase
MYHIHYGFSLAFAAYLLLETIKRNPTFLLKALSALFFISISINLILNIGRTGYVLYIISLLLFIFLNYKQNSLKALPIALLSLTLAFLLAYQFSPLFKKRIDTTTQSVTKAFTKNDFKSSIGLRIEKYKLAYEAFKEKPLLGYGTGEHLQSIHQLAVEKKLWFASSIAGHPNLDSEYLDIIIQFGLLGLIVYLNIFYQSIKYKQPDPLLKNIQIVLVVLYILFSFEAVGVIHHKLAETFLFFISITLIKQTDKETPLPRTSNMELFIYILVGGIFFLRSQLHLGTHIKSFFIALF